MFFANTWWYLWDIWAPSVCVVFEHVLCHYILELQTPHGSQVMTAISQMDNVRWKMAALMKQRQENGHVLFTCGFGTRTLTQPQVCFPCFTSNIRELPGVGNSWGWKQQTSSHVDILQHRQINAKALLYIPLKLIMSCPSQRHLAVCIANEVGRRKFESRILGRSACKNARMARH